MLTTWLYKKNNPACLIFMAGWGMDPTPFQDVACAGHDLLMVYDYREPGPLALSGLQERYEYLHLLAWSMGVWVAGVFVAGQADRFTSISAVNGTLKPIDDRFGIAERDYYGMIDEFSPQIPHRFYADMFTDQEESQRFLGHKPQRPLDDIHEELELLARHYQKYGPGRDIFTHKIVGSRDRIMPARSQLRAWGRKVCVVEPVPHFPFFTWQGWRAP